MFVNRFIYYICIKNNKKMTYETRQELEEFLDGIIHPEFRITEITVKVEHKTFKNHKLTKTLKSTPGVMLDVMIGIKTQIINSIM